jgi:ectoine hydroxylase-related dioxygenase (phytanoyl-CoA dioxygenase family)
MECIAGSHAWQRIHKPDFDAQRAAYDLLGWALEPGDAIAFHFATVHGAPATLTLSEGAPFEGPDFSLVYGD